MLAVEFRYLASIASIAGALVLAVGIAIGIGVPAHMPTWAIVSAAFVLIAASGFLATMSWLRRTAARDPAVHESATLEPQTPQPRARYAPMLVSAVVIVLFAFTISSRIQEMNATHWRIGLDSFVASTLTGLFFIYLSLRSYGPNSNRKVDPATQRTRDAIVAAHALPTREERRAALLPIWRRGYMRLGLIVSVIPLYFILLPHVGMTLALIASCAIEVGTFLFLHRRFGL